ncbi:MAG TPA: tetratricopeptide repeat protein, partial [Pseudomonas sp.]
MSLVNDMLRDLEARRASPAERAPLEGLLPADEGASGRRAGRQRLLLGLLWGALAVLAALLLARLWLASEAAPVLAVAPPAVAPAAVAPILPAAAASAEAALASAPPIQLLATLPQHGEGRFILQLLLDRAPSYQRSEQSGVVGLRLPQLRLSDDGPRGGRFEQGGRSLSWSLQPLGDGAELLLVGLGDGLQVLDRLEPAGERWQLWVEVPFTAASGDTFDPAQLPVAGGEEEAEADDYPPAVQAAAAAPVKRDPPSEQLAARAALPEQRAPAVAAPVSRTPQVSVASHQPDALAEARQALLAGDSERAIALLEELHRRQPDNREALRWLARAWLSAG